MSGYILTPIAQQDLVEIRAYYLAEAGYRVARQMLVEFVHAFRFLARNPGVGHLREDLAENRSIVFWAMRDFLILYKPGTKPLRVITIVKGSQDVPRVIGSRRL